MNLYKEYIEEIKDRKSIGLNPKPIDNGKLLSEIVKKIKDLNHPDRDKCVQYFIYNVTPGTTSAANLKAKFLKEIILNDFSIEEISPSFAFELLSHMKGGASVEVLIDLLLGTDDSISKRAADVLKSQVFLYEADMIRLEKAYQKGKKIAKNILVSYSKAEFFTMLPKIDEEIKIVTYVAGIGDVSTDFLSPGSDAHSRSDRELHGKCIFEHDIDKQNQLIALQSEHPDKTIMLVAEKGTMGVGSSRMSGVNNVALWIGKKASPYVPFINIAPIVAGTNGISPIFLTTVDVTGGIGLNLKNWRKKKDLNGDLVLDQEGEPVLEEVYSVKTGTVLTINTKHKKLYSGDKELCDISSAFTPQKMEFMRAGGSYAVVFGKKLQTFAAKVLGIKTPDVFSPSKEIANKNHGLTAVEKIFNKNIIDKSSGKVFTCRF